jgi:hypothetical protein
VGAGSGILHGTRRFLPIRQNKTETSLPIERRAVAFTALVGSCGYRR